MDQSKKVRKIFESRLLKKETLVFAPGPISDMTLQIALFSKAKVSMGYKKRQKAKPIVLP